MRNGENYGGRIVRIIFEAGYKAKDIPNLTIDEILEIKGITVSNIKAVRYAQRKLKEENSNESKSKLCHRKQH